MCCMRVWTDASGDGAHSSACAGGATARGAPRSATPAAGPSAVQSRLSRRDLIQGTLLTAGGIAGGLLAGRALAQMPPPPTVCQCTAAVPVVGTGGLAGAHCFTSPLAGDRIRTCVFGTHSRGTGVLLVCSRIGLHQTVPRSPGRDYDAVEHVDSP